MNDATAGTRPLVPNYDIVREVGRGGMGIVYEALDRRRGGRVALKTLQGRDPAGLYRFKQEFRALAGVAHANLVTLFDLACDSEPWFFTMEFVEGMQLLERVRHGGDVRRLFGQLAEGLAALHAAGLLHRDVKPSNVMVARDGRVVLLDFGLAAEMSAQGTHQSTVRHAVGTASYMAPEQARGDPVTPATDWYSFGVVLYEALAGRTPYEYASAPEIFAALLSRDGPRPAHPCTVAPDAPRDLADLALALLERDPGARPGGAEVLQKLHAKRTTTRAAASGLVGRDAPLALLHAAFDTMLAERRPVTLLVSGASGMGKSALAQHFLDEIASSHAAVVLAGRCYEHESVPYKALDSQVDALSRFLARLPQLEAEALLPRDVAALTRVFPVLLRVDAVAGAVRRSGGREDPHEVRRLAFAGLRELFARMGDRRPLVIHADDLQWADLDSVGVLADLLRPPRAPAVLVLGCFRSEDVAASPFLQALRDLPEDVVGDRREIHVGALPPADCAQLVAAMRGPTGEAADAIIRESGGNPLFVQELVEHARSVGGAASLPEGGALTLDRVILGRAARMDPAARRLLEVVAVSGGPVSEELASAAASLGDGHAAAFAALRSARLLRGRGVQGLEEVDTYHDRVREAVAASLDSARRTELHARIARALEAAGSHDPELLARHLDGAGERAGAGVQYARAAAAACDAFAFDHAAALYRRAIELCEPRGAERRDLLRRLGDALANARRGADAAQVFLAAAEGTGGDEAFDLQWKAAQQLLVSGRVDEWQALVTPLMRRVDVGLPRSPAAAVLPILVRRTWIRIRGYGTRPRDESEVPAAERRVHDLAIEFGRSFSHVDNIRTFAVHLRWLVWALRTGDPYRVSQSLGHELAVLAFQGAAVQHRSGALLARALEEAERSGRPNARGIVLTWAGIAAYLLGQWRPACESCAEGHALLLEHAPGDASNLHYAVFYGFRAQEFLGALAEMSERLPRAIDDADARGDLFAATDLRTRCAHLLRLREDAPDAAARELTVAIERWSKSGFHLQHLYETTSRLDVLHYAGASPEAWRLLLARWDTVRRTQAFRFLEHVRVIMGCYRGRAALAAAAEETGAARREFLREAEKRGRSVVRQHSLWGDPLGVLTLAGVAAMRGDRSRALGLLDESERGLSERGMALFAASARRRRGELVGGPEGDELVRASEERMRAEGIVRPDRWADLYAPGFRR